MYRVCIIMHSKYLGRQQRHSADEVHNTARPYSDLNLLLPFCLFSPITGSLKPKVTLRWRRALSQAPSIYTIVDPFKGSSTKAKKRRRRAAGYPKDLHDTFSF